MILQSIEILKDAYAQTAIYGSQSGERCNLITTKKGAGGNQNLSSIHLVLALADFPTY